MPRKPQGKRTTDAEGNVTVRGKSGNGAETIYYHAGVKAWRASYTVNGTRKWVQAPTQEKAEERRKKAISDGLLARKGPTRFTARTTVGQFCDWWLTDEVRHRVRQSTLDEMRSRCQRLGALRDEPVVDISLEALISWQSSLLDTMKPKTVANTRITVGQMFRRAVTLGLLQHSPAAGLLPPVVPKTKGAVLTADVATQLIEATRDQRYGAVVQILYTKGPRVSEALGIGWGDIDFDAGTVDVRRAVVYDKLHGTHLGPPKTDNATGTFYLAPGVLASLKRHKRAQAEERLRAETWATYTYDGEPVDLVFTQPSGKLVSRQHIDTMTRRIAKTLGIDTAHLGTHVGRRSVITSMHKAGIPIEDIARFIGHGDAKTTSGYVAEHGDRPKSTADAAARLLDNAKIV